MFGFAALLLALILSFCMYLPRVWNARVFLSGAIVALVSFGATNILVYSINFGGVVAFVACAYIVINAVRIAQARLAPKHLYLATRRSFVILWIWASIGSIAAFYDPSGDIWQYTYLGLCAVVGSVILTTTIRRLLATRSAKLVPLGDNELPSVTVAIAARNETATLNSCLEALLASDYPKLEILVLDDCSQDKTADIIKHFAHDGVRFVQGEPPIDESWLPKNKAYQQLLDESLGEIVLFMGVDVRLRPDTIRRLVEHMIAQKLQMVSVLPKRTKSGWVAAFIQPMRYWWELAVPRYKQHPSVLSTLWAVRRQALVDRGGFLANARAIVPEWHISREFDQQGTYAFLRHDNILQVTTHKDFVSQWLTAVRIRYPQIRRRPELVFLQGTIMVIFMAGPFVLLPLYLAVDTPTVFVVLCALAVGSLALAQTLIAAYTNPKAAFFAPLNFPFAVALDLVALHISMWRYEFGEIEWKGRNVCEPAFEVIPRLPEIK